MISELSALVSVLEMTAADAVWVTDQCFGDLHPVVFDSRLFYRSCHTVCGNEEEKGLCSQTLHIVCKSCDAAEVSLIVTGNRRWLTPVR